MTKLNYFIAFLIMFSFNTKAQDIPAKSIKALSVGSNKFSNAPKKIFIRTFKIYYQMIAEAEKTVYGGRQFGGGTYTGNATARLAVGVDGLAPEDLQSLTNDIYQEYIRALEEIGLEVITAKDLPDLTFFDGWRTIEGPHINQEQIKGSLMVVPEGFSYKVKKITKKGKEKTGGFLAGLQNVNGGQAAEFTSSMYGLLPKVSKELDNAIVAEVAISIPSIYLNPKSKLGTAKIKGGPHLRLGKAKVSYISGVAKGMGVASAKSAYEMTLKQAIPIEGVFEGKEFKVVANKSRTLVPSYAAFFTVENKTVELTNVIRCKPEIYKKEVSKPVKALLTQSVEQLNKGLQGKKIK